MFDREKSNELLDKALALADELRNEGMAYADYSNLYSVITDLYDGFSEVDGEIESLQAQLAESKTTLSGTYINIAEYDRVCAALAESQRREKAAVEDMRAKADCTTCKHLSQKPGHGTCNNCDINYSGWEWRGPQEASRDDPDLPMYAVDEVNPYEAGDRP
jgi:hypothetical protein